MYWLPLLINLFRYSRPCTARDKEHSSRASSVKTPANWRKLIQIVPFLTCIWKVNESKPGGTPIILIRLSWSYSVLQVCY